MDSALLWYEKTSIHTPTATVYIFKTTHTKSHVRTSVVTYPQNSVCVYVCVSIHDVSDEVPLDRSFLQLAPDKLY